MVLNRAEMPTGDIVRQRDASLRVAGARGGDRRRRRARRTSRAFDANAAAERLLGDSVFANVMMLGYAWQQGLVPVSFDALARAIELNGVASRQQPRRLRARPDPGRAARGAGRRARTGEAPQAETLDALIERRAAFLADYQDAA